MLHRPDNGAVSQRFLADDGREYVSIITAKHKAFAAACLTELSNNDGKERRWMLQHKAVTVPTDVLAAARERLEGGGES